MARRQRLPPVAAGRPVVVVLLLNNLGQCGDREIGVGGMAGAVAGRQATRPSAPAPDPSPSTPVAATKQLASKPVNLSVEQAAAVPVSALTAVQAVRDPGQGAGRAEGAESSGRRVVSASSRSRSPRFCGSSSKQGRSCRQSTGPTRSARPPRPSATCSRAMPAARSSSPFEAPQWLRSAMAGPGVDRAGGSRRKARKLTTPQNMS
ncbi:MAG: hypothetical protein QOF20_1532 [Acidimicrobiaceae bacterium]|nr:hypothetical protein [Acidimicrobiaceae bacterium]